MSQLNGTSCCGVKEYHGLLDTPEATLKFVGKQMWGSGQRGAFIIFTDTGMAYRAEAIRRYVAHYKLGKVTVSHTERNPNSGNRLTVYVWAINQDAFASWFATEGWTKAPAPTKLQAAKARITGLTKSAYARLHPMLRRQGI